MLFLFGTLVSAFKAGLPGPPMAAAVVRAVAPIMNGNELQPVNPSAAAVADDAVLIELAQRPPANAHPGAAAALGLFSRTGQIINGKPAYVHTTQPNMMLWWMPNGDWCIGLKSELGLSRCFAYCSKNRGTMLPYDIKGKWKFLDNGAGFVENVDVRVSRQPQPASQVGGAVVATGQGIGDALTTGLAAAADPQSPEVQAQEAPSELAQQPPMQAPPAAAAERRIDPARGVDGNRRQPQVPPQQTPPQQQASAMEARMAHARAACSAAAEAKYRTLMQPVLEAYSADQIDEDELNRRKHAVREQLQAECWSGLEMAIEVAAGDYEAAMAARAAAQAAEAEAAAARAAAQAAEAEAEARLDAALRAVEQGHEQGATEPAPTPGVARQPDRAERLRQASRPNPIADVVSADQGNMGYSSAGVIIR